MKDKIGIPKQPEESGIWQEGSSKFSSKSGAERATIAEWARRE